MIRDCQRTLLDCGGKRSATPLLRRSESGVALRLPPQSKFTGQFIAIMPLLRSLGAPFWQARTINMALLPELEPRTCLRSEATARQARRRKRKRRILKWPNDFANACNFLIIHSP